MDISSKMQNVIEEQLKEIEEKENVKIIYCVESGSRAWGFASPDSDYDVRFIYVRNKEYYLKLNKNRDVIEWRLDDVLVADSIQDNTAMGKNFGNCKSVFS